MAAQRDPGDAVRPDLAPALLEEEHRQMGDWWFRQEYLCEFVATTDQVFAYDLVMGALSDEVAPLFRLVIQAFSDAIWGPNAPLLYQRPRPGNQHGPSCRRLL